MGMLIKHGVNPSDRSAATFARHWLTVVDMPAGIMMDSPLFIAHVGATSWATHRLFRPPWSCVRSLVSGSSMWYCSYHIKKLIYR